MWATLRTLPRELSLLWFEGMGSLVALGDAKLIEGRFSCVGEPSDFGLGVERPSSMGDSGDAVASIPSVKV
jgi:hypothetical protein